LSAAFAGLALLAPLVYTALGYWDSTLKAAFGRERGLVASYSIVVVGVTGELAALGLLMAMSNISLGGKLSCWAVLAIAELIVFRYSLRSASLLARRNRPSKDEMKARQLGAPSGLGTLSAGAP
jgi:cyanate permease